VKLAKKMKTQYPRIKKTDAETCDARKVYDVEP